MNKKVELSETAKELLRLIVYKLRDINIKLDDLEERIKRLR